MPRLPQGLAVLHQRDYRLFFIGQSASLLGDGMVNVALAFAVLELGGSASQIGLVLACETLALVACLLVGGVVADRTSRRAVMVGADLARVASQGALAALLIAGTAESGPSRSWPASPARRRASSSLPRRAWSRRSSLRRTCSRRMGYARRRWRRARSSGRLAAGVLVATAGPGWALGIDAATFAVSAAFLSRLRLPPRIAREAESFFQELREGWRAFRSRTWVWAFVASAAIGNMLWGAWSVLGPVVADRDLGGPPLGARSSPRWASAASAEQFSRSARSRAGRWSSRSRRRQC